MRLWIMSVVPLLIGAALAAGCGRSHPPRQEGVKGEAQAVKADDHGHGSEPGHAEHADHAGHDDHDDHAGHDDHEAGDVPEGHVRIAADVLRDAGITFAPVGPRLLVPSLEFSGEIVLNSDRLAHVVPRFPGVAREVRKQLGDRVRAGDVMAIIESNESLTSYEVKSLTSGTVIEKHITLGEFVSDNADIYVVADLATVWLNLVVPPRDLDQLRTGQTVRVHAPHSEETVTGNLSYIGPLVVEQTRSVTARAELDNRSGRWRPGLFATGRVETGSEAVPLAVPRDALQTVGGRPTLFVRNAPGVEARPITTGRQDANWIEVLSGVAPGDVVAVTKTFLLKAELGKAEAEHVH